MADSAPSRHTPGQSAASKQSGVAGLVTHIVPMGQSCIGPGSWDEPSARECANAKAAGAQRAEVDTGTSTRKTRRAKYVRVTTTVRRNWFTSTTAINSTTARIAVVTQVVGAVMCRGWACIDRRR